MSTLREFRVCLSHCTFTHDYRFCVVSYLKCTQFLDVVFFSHIHFPLFHCLFQFNRMRWVMFAHASALQHTYIEQWYYRFCCSLTDTNLTFQIHLVVFILSVCVHANVCCVCMWAYVNSILTIVLCRKRTNIEIYTNKVNTMNLLTHSH